MWKKLCISLCAVCFTACIALPAVYAADSVESSSASSDSVATAETALGDLSGGMGAAIDEYGSGLSDAFENGVLPDWSNNLTGPLQYAAFLQSAFVDAIFPAASGFTLYLILLCVFIAVLGIVKALID